MAQTKIKDAKIETISPRAYTAADNRRLTQTDLQPSSVKSRNLYTKKDGQPWIEMQTENNRIVVHDGTTNRIVIGNV